MDYKLNKLLKEVECEQVKIADIPTLKFGSLANGQEVFDSTRYFEENEIQPIDYLVFSRICKTFINTLIDRTDMLATELFFLNTDGHILMNKDLTVIFLQFSHPDMFIYFTQMILDLLENGIAFSDGLIASLAASRMPSELLKDIIDTRNGTGTS